MSQIIPLDPSHAADMAALHGLCFDMGWSQSDMAVHTRRDFCAGFHAPFVGFIIVQHSAYDADILTLCTHPEMRRQGLAQQLLDHTEQALREREVTQLFLEVAEDNHAARCLYKRQGFDPIGRRPAYYKRAGERVAAISFRKRLDAHLQTE